MTIWISDAFSGQLHLEIPLEDCKAILAIDETAISELMSNIQKYVTHCEDVKRVKTRRLLNK